MSNLTVDVALRSVDPKKLEVYLNKHPDLSFLLCTLVNSLVESDASNMHEHLIQQLQCLKEQHTEQVSNPTCYTPVSRFEKSPSSKKLSIVIFGASGDLARKKTLPALHSLFYGGLLPEDVLITGYNRSVIDLPSFLKKVSFKSMKHECMQLFQERLDFVSGSYHKDEDFVRLNERLREREGGPANRIFYLALPPTVFLDAAKGIHKFCTAENDAWTRVIIEKPFGFDLNSSNALSTSIGALFREEQTFRIDHYLGKEMVQNLVALRFSNKVFSCIWDAKNIANVSITFKEPFGTEGRGGYFDTFGIIRDVIQNHLLQIVALIAMEPPQNLDAESIRNEKVAVLKLVEELNLDHVVLGQYAANPETGKPGYLDDDTVPKNSTTPTFTTCVLNIRNDRWKNVPFILKAGKALDDRSVVVRIQFHEQIQPFGLGSGSRNELVIRCQPEECVYFKFNSKVPGEMGQKLMMTDLDLTYNRRFSNVQIPEAYESLIYEAICGSSTNFVRADELEVAWKIFTPLLQRIESEKIKPIPYVYGSRGPKESDELIAKVGYVRSQFYKYSK